MNANKIPSPTTAALRSLAGLLENGGQTPLRQTPLGQTPPPTAPAAAVQAAAELRGVLAAKNSEAEATLLRRQLAQLTADFQFNLKLLEDRDLELERAEAVMSGLKESAAAKELALADTKRLLAEKDTALREKEARVAVLEERQRQTMDLCERQVADARSSRDEEIAKLEGQCAAAEQQMLQRIAAVESIAAREKADIISGYEKQLTAAVASEREARAAAAQARQEGEASRAALRRAEAKVAELELAAQRMVTQFEASLQALQTLEGQYSSLAAEAAEERRTAAGHIRQLELEVESLRASKAVLQDEQDTMVNSLAQQLQERERQLSEAKQRYHHASLDNADLTEALTHAKAELQQARSRAEQLESQVEAARGQSSQAQAAAERERSAHAQTRGLLDTTRLQLETARRESEVQAQELVQLKEAAAVLDAQRGDTRGALEAAQAKLRSAEERMALLGEQMEQERAAHAQALSAQEAQLRTQAERSLAAVQGDKAALQQALEQANRQLQQAYRELETLRLQLDHARLAPPGAPRAAAAAAAVGAAAGGSGQPALSGAQHGSGSSNYRGGRQGLGPGAWPDDHSELIGAVYEWKDQEAATAAGAGAEGSSAGGLAGLQGQHIRGLGFRGRYPDATGAALPPSEMDGASSISGDVFSDVASLDGGDASGARQGLQPATAAAAGSRGAGAAYQQHQQQQQQQPGERGGRQVTHLHRHLDSLASKLSSFERAAERARHAGTLAASEVARSAEELPQSLQRRQVEVAEDVLKRKLAREREKFLKERAQLDEELRRRELLLAEQEEELRKLHKEREEEAAAQRQAELREKERELRQLAQQLQERQQQSAGAVLAASSAPASSAATMPHSPVQRPPAFAAAATAPASLAGTAPASPAHQLAQQRQHGQGVAAPTSTGNAALLPPHSLQSQQQQQQGAQLRTGPGSSSSAPLAHSLLQQQQQLRGSLQRAPGASSLAQQTAGGPVHSRMGALRASGGSVSGLSVPASGASSLRSSLAAGQLGSGGWAAAGHGPIPALEQQLAPGATPRGSVESLYIPTSMAGPAAAGARLGSYTAQSSPRPASRLAGVAGAAPVGGLGVSSRASAAAAAGAGAGAGPAGDGGGEDPLAKARRQVMLAKDYLRQVAEMGGKLARGGAD